MRPVTLALALSCAAMLGPAAADNPTMRFEDDASAVALRVSCTRQDVESVYACRQTIASTIDVHRLMVANHPELAAYCPDRDPTIEEAQRVFLAWMERRESRSLALFVSGGVGVLMALREKSPCFR